MIKKLIIGLGMALLPCVSYASHLYTTNANNIQLGILPNERLDSSSVTLQGNDINIHSTIAIITSRLDSIDTSSSSLGTSLDANWISTLATYTYVTTLQSAIATDTTTLKTRIDGHDLFRSSASVALDYSSRTAEAYNIFYPTGQAKIDGLELFKSTGQLKIESWNLAKSTVELGVRGWNLFSTTGTQKIESWELSKSTISSRITGIEGALVTGALTPSATFQATQTGAFAEFFSTICAWRQNEGQGVLSMSSSGTFAILPNRVDGRFLISTDSLNFFSTPSVASNMYWASCISGNGKYGLVGGNGTPILLSSNYLLTWGSAGTPDDDTYGKCGMSYDGSTIAYTADGSYIKISTNYGVSWADRGISTTWRGVTVSSDGMHMIAGANSGQFYQSEDGGQTWTKATVAGGTYWGGAISGNGQYRLTGQDSASGRLLKSNDFGVTYTTDSFGNDNYESFAMDYSGQYQLAGTNDKLLYSEDFGEHFAQVTGIPSINYGRNLAISGDGSKILTGRGTDATKVTNYSSGTVFNYIGGGNIGLNTTNPSSKFEVINGSITVWGVNSGLAIRDAFGNTDFTVLNNGRVGIGVSNPSYSLHLLGIPFSASGYTAWSVASDIRLKKDEYDYTELALPKIMKLNPIKFKYNEKFYSEMGIKDSKESKEILGFSAQEVSEVYPSWVSLKPLKNPSVETKKETSYDVYISSTGKTEKITVPVVEEVEDTKYFSLNTSDLQIELTKAVQEQYLLFQEFKSAFCEEHPLNRLCK